MSVNQEKTVKTCPKCGKPYELGKYRQHSIDMHSLGEKTTLVKICPICGKQFDGMNDLRKRYCSEECSQKARKNKWKTYSRKYYHKLRNELKELRELRAKLKES